MADEKNPNSRSIDERLDALTMNLELQVRETETLRESVGELRETVGELRETVGELRQTVHEGFASVNVSIASLTEDVSLLRESTSALLATAVAHENRLQRLERRAG